MTLSKIKVLLTAVGCPGAVTMIRALKNNGERELEIVGTDMRPEAAGRFSVDMFYTVPAGSSETFIPRMLDIVQRERPDLILPQSSYEILPLARHRREFEALGALPVIAEPEAVERGGDKWLTYQALEGSDVPRPRSILCTSLDAFTDAVYQLGYPEQRVCFKPPFSKGTRGFRILTAEADRLHLLLNEKPDAMLMTLDEALDVLGDAETFPELIVMEYAEGKEHTVDLFCQDGQALMGFVKTREAIRAGLAMYFETVDHPRLWHNGQTIVETLDLDYFVNIQFKGGKLLEVNPRVSTFVHQENFNMPYLGLKYCLGEIGASGLQAAAQRIRATRRTVRYYDQVFYDVEELE
jgi:carbamoyl-phosphate synthase large subunit